MMVVVTMPVVLATMRGVVVPVMAVPLMFTVLGGRLFLAVMRAAAFPGVRNGSLLVVCVPGMVVVHILGTEPSGKPYTRLSRCSNIVDELFPTAPATG